MSSPSNSEISPLSSPVRISDGRRNDTNIPPLSLLRNSTPPSRQYDPATDEDADTINEHGFTVYSRDSAGTLIIQDEDEATHEGGVGLLPHAVLVDYGSIKSPGAVVHSVSISSSGSSSSSLSSMRMMEPELVQDNVLKKIIDEETPLIGGKQSTSTSEGGDGRPKFLMGISEKEFWIIFTGILVVNFVSPSCEYVVVDDISDNLNIGWCVRLYNHGINTYLCNLCL